MNKKVKQMEVELQNSGKIPCFEINVINKETGKEEYLIFNIFFRGNSLVSQHEPLTYKEKRSKKIASKYIVVDTFFSLDQNLELLYDNIINAIFASDFFKLTDN